jgi:hypothetical protein
LQWQKGAVFRRKIERVICALYDKETRYLTPDGPKGPSVTIIVPKPEAEFPPAIKQALEKRRAATKVGSAVLLTLTISKGAGENRCEVLSKAVKNFKMRSQDPRRRAEYRELGICFSFSAYEQTFGIEGVHHHFHAMLVLNHCIEPNAEAELIFSKKIERLYLRELKAVLKDKWSEEYLLPCYKGQAYSCETIPTEFGETPIFYRWQQKHADEWRPCSEQDYKRLQRLKKCSRPILNIVTRDQDEAFATGLNEMSSAIESGKRKWRVCRRSPIKGGVSVQSEGGRQVLFRGRPSQTSRAEDIQFSLRP